MNARRLALTGLMALCTLGGGMAVSSAPALAVRNHVFSFAFGASGSGDGQFNGSFGPGAVAVNEATGDVYVLDQGNDRVEYFSSAGAYLGQFNGSGLLPGEGKPAGSGGLPGEVETGQFERPRAIAIDNSTSPFDPSAGDVYIVDSGEFEFGRHDVIDKFSSTGAYVGQIAPAHGSAQEPELGGVAVDTSGTVWVNERFREEYLRADVLSLTDAVPNEPITSHTLQSSEFASNLGVDSKTDLYFGSDFGSAIAKYASSGELLKSEFGRETESTGLAVESPSDDVYSVSREAVARFDSEGGPIERFGGGLLSFGSGVGVNSSSGAVYVADGGAGVVDVFTLEPPSAPTVEGWVSDVTADSATLHAEVNPRGASTEYHLEYGPCAFGPVCTAPVPDGQLGAEFETRSFSLHLQGLQPGAAYHFRVVAHNQLGTTEGTERTFTTQPPAGSSAVLPDGRAWEMVSPPDKHGAALEAPMVQYGKETQASVTGDAVTYAALAPTEEQPQGNRASEPAQLLSRRSGSGWTTKVITTPFTEVGGYLPWGEYLMFSPDLSTAALYSLSEAKLSSDATERTPYLRHNDTCEASPATCYVPLVTPADVQPPGSKFGDLTILPTVATPDLSHVIVRSEDPTGNEVPVLYEWSKGKLQPVTILPGGEPAENGQVGDSENNVRHAISDDGEHVVFSANEAGESHLYTRDMVNAETVKVDAAEAGAAGGESRPVFQLASSDGTRVFFLDTARLTTDSTASGTEFPPKSDLYEFDVQTGKLTDLTVDASSGEHADVQGLVQGASEDGSYVYFVANGVLASGASPGNCGYVPPASATCNLYVRRGGATRFIAALAGDDQQWSSESTNAELEYVTARVSPNGRWFAFMSARSLTGYDNRDANSGEPDEEVFLYDAGAGRLRCVSCNPTGARPVGMFESKVSGHGLGPLVDSTTLWAGRGLAALIPGWYKTVEARAQRQSQYLSDAGRLFFMSDEGLVAQDVNGLMDVYEYEPEGEGDCTSAGVTFGQAAAGCVGLITSGGSTEESVFMDATENGDEVFFLTAAKLRPEDYDNALDMYDARVCTSGSPCLAVPPPSPPPCSTGDSCKPAPSPQPAIFGAPSSATFSGAGNVTAGSTPVVRSRSLTRAQKLQRALRACKGKRGRRKRVACARQARKRYGGKPARRSSSPTANGR
jgi:hypothetical protein